MRFELDDSAHQRFILPRELINMAQASIKMAGSIQQGSLRSLDGPSDTSRTIPFRTGACRKLARHRMSSTACQSFSENSRVHTSAEQLLLSFRVYLQHFTEDTVFFSDTLEAELDKPCFIKYITSSHILAGCRQLGNSSQAWPTQSHSSSYSCLSLFNASRRGSLLFLQMGYCNLPFSCHC